MKRRTGMLAAPPVMPAAEGAQTEKIENPINLSQIRWNCPEVILW